MGFWDLSDGAAATDDVKGEYETGGGRFDPIPDGSDVLGEVEKAAWADKDGNEFIELTWTVLAPEEYQNRKVFQKLWVTDLDPQAKDNKKAEAKRDKARKMLATIDFNAGGKLARKSGKPTDDDLLHLTGKPMNIKCMVWAVSDARGTATGNWISAVAPKTKPVNITNAPPPAATAGRGGQASTISRSGSKADDDEIPF